MRRGNLTDLQLSDLTFAPQGLTIHVRHEKQDRAGKGRDIAIPYGKPLTCPVRAVEAWLDQRGRADGPLFTAFTRGVGGITGDRMRQIIKESVAKIGLSPELRAGHSTRAGFVTAAVLANVPLALIARQSGQTLGTLQRYIRPVEAWSLNPCTALGL